MALAGLAQWIECACELKSLSVMAPKNKNKRTVFMPDHETIEPFPVRLCAHVVPVIPDDMGSACVKRCHVKVKGTQCLASRSLTWGQAYAGAQTPHAGTRPERKDTAQYFLL